MRTLGILVVCLMSSVVWASSNLAMPSPPKEGGWVATASSLLLYRTDGTLMNEIGLGRWKENAGKGLTQRRQMRGGISANGRFAWHWQKIETLPERSDVPVSSLRTLIYLDSAGRTLWKNELADAPPGLEPFLSSQDGNAALIAEYDLDGWTVVGVNASGERLMEVRGARRIDRMELTRNGRFALVLWNPQALEDPAVYSFMDLRKRAGKDYPAYVLQPGNPRIEENGSIVLGPKTIFSFR